MAERWNAVIARLGMPTGDKRILSPGGITNRDLPLPLLWQRTTGEGHSGAVVVGAIEDIQYGTDMVTASGRFLDVRGAAEAEMLTEAGLTGPSVDLFDDVDFQEVRKLIDAGVVGPDIVDNMDDIEYTYDEGTSMVVITSGRIAGATLVAIPAFADVNIRIAQPESIVASVHSEGWADMPIADVEREWDGDAARARVLAWSTSGDTVDWGKYARAFLHRDDDADPETTGAYGYGIADVIDGTLTIIPRGVFAAAAAVQGARGATPGEDAEGMKRVLSGIYSRLDRTPPWDEQAMALVASVAQAVRPSLDLFRNPMLPSKTPLTVTEPDELGIRRVFGHFAPWGECHIGLPGCVTAPASQTDYAHFLTGAERTDAGVIPVGVITVGGGHAAPGLGFRAAIEHYDNVGTAVASVNAGEDEFGIWFSGYIIPGTPDSMISELLRHPLSGDWREIGGSMELIAACAVNHGGFPITRPIVKFSMGRQKTLIGAFGLTPNQEHPESLDKFKAATETDEKAAPLKGRVAWKASQLKLKGR
jgi:hypothetical protein